MTASIEISGKRAAPTLLSAGSLALTMRYQNKYQAAYNLLRDTLENTHWSVSNKVPLVQLLNILAKTTLDCGMYDMAQSLSCDVVRMSIGLYGERHPYTLNRMSDMAVVFAWKGHMSGAEAITRYALDGLEQALGTDHPHCLRTARRLADYIRFQQRYDDASSRLKRIRKCQELHPGPHHPDTLSTMSSLGAVFALQGYLKDAEVLLRRAHTGQEEYLGLKHPSTMWTGQALAGLKALQNKHLSMSEEVQPALLDFLGPKPGPVPRHDVWKHPHSSSPFGTATEDDIIVAAMGGDLVKLRTILTENTVDTLTRGRALREAAASCKEAVVQFLLDRHAPIDAQGGFYGTALQAAAFAGGMNIVRLLLDRQADINLRGGIFGNAVRAAVLGRHTDIAHRLLNHYPAGHIQQDVLNSSMQLALATQQQSLITQLLEAGANIDGEDNLFGSSLQQASFFGQRNIMALLLARNADIDMRAGIFGCPLQAAISTDNTSAVEYLLISGANLRWLYNNSDSWELGRVKSGCEAMLAKMLTRKPTDPSQLATPAASTESHGHPVQASAEAATDPPVPSPSSTPVSKHPSHAVPPGFHPKHEASPTSSSQLSHVPRRILGKYRRKMRQTLAFRHGSKSS